MKKILVLLFAMILSVPAFSAGKIVFSPLIPATYIKIHNSSVYNWNDHYDIIKINKCPVAEDKIISDFIKEVFDENHTELEYSLVRDSILKAVKGDSPFSCYAYLQYDDYIVFVDAGGSAQDGVEVEILDSFFFAPVSSENDENYNAK